MFTLANNLYSTFNLSWRNLLDIKVKGVTSSSSCSTFVSSMTSLTVETGVEGRGSVAVEDDGRRLLEVDGCCVKYKGWFWKLHLSTDFKELAFLNPLLFSTFFMDSFRRQSFSGVAGDIVERASSTRDKARMRLPTEYSGSLSETLLCPYMVRKLGTFTSTSLRPPPPSPKVPRQAPPGHPHHSMPPL